MATEIFKTASENLKALGIHKGDTVLVHSSLRTLGNYPNKAQMITEALKKSVGDDGTLLMPALTYKTVTKKNPVFNIKETPSCVGWLTEYFRTQPGVQRSLHPTHSVCAFGKNTEYLIGDHQLDNTPCGKYSPFRKLRDVNGKILFLGCSLNANTSMHGVEELSEPGYLFGKELEYTLILGNGDILKKKYITQNFRGFEQHYDRILNILSQDDYSFGKVLMADCYLMQSNSLWEKAHKQLCDIPFYFVEKINE
jgi:aminoglycoside 3-N-acetyltransferase